MGWIQMITSKTIDHIKMISKHLATCNDDVDSQIKELQDYKLKLNLEVTEHFSSIISEEDINTALNIARNKLSNDGVCTGKVQITKDGINCEALFIGCKDHILVTYDEINDFYLNNFKE